MVDRVVIAAAKAADAGCRLAPAIRADVLLSPLERVSSAEQRRIAN
jgi:hypothetical protein